jgi:hypothetical protein
VRYGPWVGHRRHAPSASSVGPGMSEIVKHAA